MLCNKHTMLQGHIRTITLSHKHNINRNQPWRKITFHFVQNIKYMYMFERLEV